ncbi:TonB-dependent receptor family protein [Parabacteroides sp. OttesenSCG-928-N08]|nr:TonB-dependent receptor family protein [Parabacteroides sp. OttesenSCG-928-N08]
MKRWMIVALLCSVIQGMYALEVRIEGRLVDSKSRKGFEFAHVVLQTQDSLFIAGTTTALNGEFAFEQVAAGDYRILISAIGQVTQVIELPALQADRSLGEILFEEDAVALSDITVSASNSNSYSDRKVIYPSQQQLSASTNGITLLQQLMLPKIQVNPLFGEASLPGGGELQFRINGVKVEKEEILALQPADIKRVEFHDNPGLRYGNAEVVLDYIVHRPDRGGSLGINLHDGFNLPRWGNNSLSAKLNYKRSEFSAYYQANHRDFVEVSRENREQFNLPDGSILHRIEEGEAGKFNALWQYLGMVYSFQDADKRMFNATIRYWDDRKPHQDFSGSLYNVANPADRVSMIDNTATDSKRPSLDLYYQENLRNDQTIVVNLVGTYQQNYSRRFYQEKREGNILTDVDNQVEGKRYSLIAEAIYEKKLGINRLSAGIKHTQSHTDNAYKNGNNYHTEMEQALTYLYGEFRGKWKRLDYTLGIGTTRSYYLQQGEKGEQVKQTFNPRLSLHYSLPGSSFLRLNARLNNINPSLSHLSAVEQVIDSLQIQRGNPLLKPYNSYSLDLTYEIRRGIFYGTLWGYYEQQPKAIMDEKHWENDKIIQTWNNQKRWQRLSGRANLRVGPIRDILQLAASGGVNHYLSDGNSYSHRYTNWYTDLSMTATYKKWMLGIGLETNWNWFYGETLTGGENIHYLMLQYSHKPITIAVGAFNPFLDNHKIVEENRSRYASFHKENHIGESSRLFMAKLTYNFSFGRTFKAKEKRMENKDEETGVMRSGR